MDTRRDFLKKAMMFTGAAGMATLPMSIQKALAINPEIGSTYLDAEHIVILMQENRSFDHMFGTLNGVRGFNDPRAMKLPNDNLVWLQTNKDGETYAPFRLDIKDTKITWMGSLPHGRWSQVGARNEGKMDNWIEAKKSGDEAYAHMPLTMGYYTREDIPFYYALADAFTVCDQNFCSALSPTDPNRLHFWSGTVRADHNEDSRAFLDNDDIEKGIEWRTFPELLEQHDVSWKIYQNELSVDTGLSDEQDSWLANFGDNPLEFFNQYNVKLTKKHIEYLPARIAKLQGQLQQLQTKLQSLTEADKDFNQTKEWIKDIQQQLNAAKEDQQKYTVNSFDELPSNLKNIHQKAFITNSNDPYQRQLMPLNYNDDSTDREINIPKGDVLHQFREDIENGNLPTISWLAAPENFSDHPSAPWFGSWYLSEAMDILTKNPEVWKKTIFILAYDENDGYFDHVPPFVAPKYNDTSTGSVSQGIDTRTDHVKLQQDIVGPIGLGYRVPLVIASPWSRGGYVNSEVFDHTSTLKFLETFLNKKYKKNIEETNITQWRRTVCGDLTSTFRSFNVNDKHDLPFVKKDPFIESIHKAKFKNVPSNYKALSVSEIEVANKNPNASSYIPQQEKGIRSSCALPYELYADGNINFSNKNFEINLQAKKDFLKDATGSPFIVHARNHNKKDFSERNYALVAGDFIKDEWNTSDFNNNNYQLEVYAPNGFYRSFKGDAVDPLLEISLHYHTDLKNSLTGNIMFKIVNHDNVNHTIEITDNAYGAAKRAVQLNANGEKTILCYLDKSHNWYDFSLKINSSNMFEKRYAGHVENGKESKSDPLMGMMI